MKFFKKLLCCINHNNSEISINNQNTTDVSDNKIIEIIQIQNNNNLSNENINTNLTTYNNNLNTNVNNVNNVNINNKEIEKEIIIQQNEISDDYEIVN